MAAKVSTSRRKIDWQQVAQTADPQLVREVIARETQSWGTTLIGLGVIQLVASGFLDPVWGVVLILTGAASFLFRSAAMLPVYGVTIAWAMIANILSGEWYWMGFGALQGFWAFRVFQQFMMVRRVVGRLNMNFAGELPPRPDRAAAVFPWAGCALTASAFVGLIVLIAGIGIWYAVNEQPPSELAVGTAAVALADLACLGVGLAVAALLARFRFRVVSILALVGGSLMLGGVVILAVLG